MAAPTFVGVGSPGAGTGAVTPTIHASSTTDDIMLLFVESNSSQPAATPTGWTEFPDSPQDEGGLGSTCLSAFWKRHDGSESNPTVADTGNHTYAVIITIRGCITTGDPFDVTAGDVANSSTTAVSVPGDTTTVADCLIVGACSHGTDLPAGGTEFDNTWANASLSSLTERFDNTTDQGAGGGLGIFTGIKAAAGAVSATTATLDTASEQGRIFIALKPPAGGATTHFGSSTLTLVVNAVSSAFKRTFGSSTQTYVFGIASAGRKKTFGASSQPLVFGITSNGARKTFGVSSSPLVFNIATASFKKTFGASTQPLVFGITSNGVIVPPGPVTQFGSSTQTLAFGIVSSGYKRTFGTSTQTLAFSIGSAGAKRTFGASVHTITLNAATTSRLTARATSTLPIVLTITSAADSGLTFPGSVVVVAAAAPGVTLATATTGDTVTTRNGTSDTSTISTGSVGNAAGVALSSGTVTIQED